MADVLVNGDVSTRHVQPGEVDLGGNIHYYFFGDATNNDFFYTKSTDGKATWGTPVSIVTDATDTVSGAIWWDRWTPSDTGTKIHIVVARDSSNDIRYRALDTADDSLGTEVDVVNDTVGAGSGYRIAICKALNGNLYVKTVISGGDTFHRSDDAGATWTSRTDTTTAMISTDRWMLFPDGNSSDTADVAIIWADNNSGADTLNLLEYDNSANSWSATTIVTNDDTANRQVIANATIRGSDRHLIGIIYDRVVDASDSTIRVFDTFGSGSITELTAITIHPNVISEIAIFIAPNADIYVVWSQLVTGTFKEVRYVVSTDGGTTWSSQTQITESSPDDVRYLTVPYSMPDGGLFAPIWVDITPSPDEAEVNLTNAVSIMADLPAFTVSDITITPYVGEPPGVYGGILLAGAAR